MILTGMSDDGAKGLWLLRQRGGYTLAQDEATSVIYGMPKRALDIGAVDLVLPLDQIAGELVRITALAGRPAPGS